MTQLEDDSTICMHQWISKGQTIAEHIDGTEQHVILMECPICHKAKFVSDPSYENEK